MPTQKKKKKLTKKKKINSKKQQTHIIPIQKTLYSLLQEKILEKDIKQYVIIDGENLRGLWINKPRHQFQFKQQKSTPTQEIDIISNYFDQIEKYSNKKVYIFITKNREGQQCLFKNPDWLLLSNIFVFYVCTKGLQSQYLQDTSAPGYGRGHGPKGKGQGKCTGKRQQLQIKPQGYGYSPEKFKVCWYTSLKEASHAYCEYDDFMTYFILKLILVSIKPTQNKNVIIHSNDKEFGKIQNITRFDGMHLYPFDLISIGDDRRITTKVTSELFTQMLEFIKFNMNKIPILYKHQGF